MSSLNDRPPTRSVVPGRRWHQLLFIVSVLALSWYGMMAVHELGHVLGAVASGGSVERVVLDPLSVSRTDLGHNPEPGIVVWSGPVSGSMLPLAFFLCAPRKFLVLRKLCGFFAGFCLIANGAYIAFGAVPAIGDCAEMVRVGTPVWVMWAFGAVTIPAGLYCWHKLGSAVAFLRDPALVSPRQAYLAGAALVVVVLVLLAYG